MRHARRSRRGPAADLRYDLGGVIVGVASDYTQLALHALAHVPLVGPGDLSDAGYVAWAAEHLPAGAIEPITRLAPLIGAGAERALHWAPELFRDVEHLLASAGLETLSAEDVHRAHALRGWKTSSPAPELLRVAMLLAAKEYAARWPVARCGERLQEHRDAFERAARLHPALGDARVELAWALGARGRAFPSRLIVGVPGDWTGLAPETPAVVALHEAAVRAASGAYPIAEWQALTEVAARMSGADAALRDAHRAWLARLDLDDLCAGAALRGACDEAAAKAIREEPQARPELLARRRFVPSG